jgi:hypothetical protein
MTALVVPSEDWRGGVLRVTKVALDEGGSSTNVSVDVVDATTHRLVAVLVIVVVDQGERLGQLVIFGPHAHQVTWTAATAAADATVTVQQQQRPCVQGCTTTTEQPCRECFEAAVADYLGMLADMDVVRLLIRSRVANCLVQLKSVFVERWSRRRRRWPSPRTLHAIRVWYARTVVAVSGADSSDAWQYLEYLLAAFAPPLATASAVVSADERVSLPAWLVATAEAHGLLGLTDATLVNLFFRTRLVAEGVLPGGVNGDATVLIWRPHRHLAWCRDLLAHCAQHPLSPAERDHHRYARRDLEVAPWLGQDATVADNLEAALGRSVQWGGGGGDDNDEWSRAICRLATGHETLAHLQGRARGNPEWLTVRATMARLDNVMPLLPPCMRAAVVNGRKSKDMRNSDRHKMANYLAALGQTDVEEARVFLVGAKGRRPLPDIEDIIKKPGAKHYIYGCKKIPGTQRPPRPSADGNAMCCPFESKDACALHAGLDPNAYWSPAGYVYAKQQQQLEEKKLS